MHQLFEVRFNHGKTAIEIFRATDGVKLGTVMLDDVPTYDMADDCTPDEFDSFGMLADTAYNYREDAPDMEFFMFEVDI